MLRSHAPTVFLACRGLMALGLLSGCSGGSQAAQAVPPTSSRLGDMRGVVSVKELMRDILDPASDNIFDAVRIDVNSHGSVTTVPQIDADWEKLRIGAVTLAEGIYLLKVPRPFAPPGDENNSSGPEATELSPKQIESMVKADPVEWNARIEAVRNVGLEVLDIVKKRDVGQLWDAGDNLNTACEDCHRRYWYPGETANFYEQLDRRLSELSKRK
jgi:hypothetical protein